MKNKIPITDCLICSHKFVDGDALSSSICLYKYIKSKKKKVAIKIKGSVPKNLKWMLDNIDVVDEIPDWVKLIIVLDAEPSEDRLGWKLPDIPIFNIDHHNYRIKEHDPENNIYVIDTFSTAEILFRQFGIKDDMLVIGAYTDTYFAKNIKQVFKFILDLDVSEEKIEEYLSRINFYSDKRTWKIIRDAKVHKCKNNFAIVETHESDLSAIEGAMKILCELNETVCLIFGDKQVKLRTSDKDLDVSIIAKRFSGGGHSFASAIPHINNVAEFKDFIIHYKW